MAVVERVYWGVGGEGEVALAGVRGWLLERKDAVAVRWFANKLALVMAPRKLF